MPLAKPYTLWQTGQMTIAEEHIADVVADASAKMQNPAYISEEVDTFMGSQPMISHYVVSFSNELTVEGVVTVLFHAALIQRAVIRSNGKTPPEVTAEDLDAAAKEACSLTELSETEPNLASYIASNVELDQDPPVNKAAQKILAHVARALARSAA
jgi:hypothetical protein